MGMKGVIKIQQQPFRNDAVGGGGREFDILKYFFANLAPYSIHSIVEGRIVEGEQKLLLSKLFLASVFLF